MKQTGLTRSGPRADDGPKHYVFLLIDGFSQLGFSCALETLSLSNRRTGRQYYSWTLVSEGGKPVSSWNGITVQVDRDLCDLDRRACAARLRLGRHAVDPQPDECGCVAG